MLNHHHGTPSNLEITHKKLNLSAGLFLDFQARISAIIIVGVACKAANKIKQTTLKRRQKSEGILQNPVTAAASQSPMGSTLGSPLFRRASADKTILGQFNHQKQTWGLELDTLGGSM